MGGSLIVDGHERCDPRATVAEFGARAAWLNDRHADPERCDLLRDGLNKPFNAPLCGVIQRVTRKGDLPAVGRDLDDASAALGAKVWQSSTDKVDRPDQVSGHNVFDLAIREFLSRAEQAVTGVADEHVDPSALCERAFDHLANCRWVGHLEHLGVECLWITLDQIGHFGGVADGSYHAVAALEELIGELATEAAANTGNKPCTLCH